MQSLNTIIPSTRSTAGKERLEILFTADLLASAGSLAGGKRMKYRTTRCRGGNILHPSTDHDNPELTVLSIASGQAVTV
jgi:hypothetical protein